MPESGARIGVVLSAGGLRGAVHLGVLRRLYAAGIRPRVLVGVSAGAVVSAFHAAVGMSIDDLIAEASGFKGKHLIVHGLRQRLPGRLPEKLARFCGIIPARLKQLERASFARLAFGIEALGIVCHDKRAGKPVYFSSRDDILAPLSPVVRASAAIPLLMPSRRLEHAGRELTLVDGGVSDPLPLAFARSELLGATHLIASDCHLTPTPVPEHERVVYIRHGCDLIGSLRSPRETLLRLVDEGERSVTPAALDKIRSWC